MKTKLSAVPDGPWQASPAFRATIESFTYDGYGRPKTGAPMTVVKKKPRHLAGGIGLSPDRTGVAAED